MGVSARFSRPSTAVIHDFDNRVRHCKLDEARFTGLRRVENLISHSEDSAAWSLESNTAHISGTIFHFPLITDQMNVPWIHDARRKDFAVSLSIRAGSPASIGKQVSLQVMGRGPDWTLSGIAVITLTDTYTRYAAIGSALGHDWSGGARLLLSPDVDDVYVEVTEWQIEDVTRQVNNHPSEYVSVGFFENHGSGADGVQYFDHENGHTVPTPGIGGGGLVTDGGPGAVIAGNNGLLIESASLQALGATNDLTNGVWTTEGVTVALDDTVPGIDGSIPFLMTEDATLGEHRLEQTLTSAVVIDDWYAGSIYVKPANPANQLSLQLWDVTAAAVVGGVDLQNGAVTVGGPDTLTVGKYDLADGWIQILFDFIVDAGHSTFEVHLSAGNYQGANAAIAHVFGPQIAIDDREIIPSYAENITTSPVTRASDILEYINVDIHADTTVIMNAAVFSATDAGAHGDWRLFATDDSDTEDTLRSYGVTVWTAAGVGTGGFAWGIQASAIGKNSGPQKYGFTVGQSTDTQVSFATCHNGTIVFNDTAIRVIDHSDKGVLTIGRYKGLQFPSVIAYHVEVYDTHMTDQELIDAVNAI